MGRGVGKGEWGKGRGKGSGERERGSGERGRDQLVRTCTKELCVDKFIEAGVGGEWKARGGEGIGREGVEGLWTRGLGRRSNTNLGFVGSLASCFFAVDTSVHKYMSQGQKSCQRCLSVRNLLVSTVNKSASDRLSVFTWSLGCGTTGIGRAVCLKSAFTASGFWNETRQ